MPVFFIEPGLIHEGILSITGPLARHLSGSLRVRPGELLWLAEAGGSRYQVRVSAVDRTRVTAQVVSESSVPPATTPCITLGLALVKGAHMDWAVQKATELGVARLVPLLTRRSVVRPKAERSDQQTRRWRSIALEAAQQSMRWDIPVVTVPTSFEAWCTGTDCHTPRLIFWEDPRATPLRERLRGRPQPTSVALAIGPEGGFEADEIELATKNGFEAVSLGPRILRTESAVLAVLTILQYEWGDLG